MGHLKEKNIFCNERNMGNDTITDFAFHMYPLE